MSEKYVTQRMTRDTLDRVSRLGKYGETFDELLNRLLDEVEKARK